MPLLDTDLRRAGYHAVDDMLPPENFVVEVRQAGTENVSNAFLENGNWFAAKHRLAEQTDIPFTPTHWHF